MAMIKGIKGIKGINLVLDLGYLYDIYKDEYPDEQMDVESFISTCETTLEDLIRRHVEQLMAQRNA